MSVEATEVREGITTSQVNQLIRYSNEDDLIKLYTSDPSRFVSREGFEEWRKKGRSIYTLTDQDKDLLGIIWFGGQSIPKRDFIHEFNPEEYGITFAIRIYGRARGRGLAQNFMKRSIGMFQNSGAFQAIPNKGIWLETSEDNEPAVKAYLRYGFQKVSEPDPRGKILMILPSQLNNENKRWVLKSGKNQSDRRGIQNSLAEKEVGSFRSRSFFGHFQPANE